MLYYLDEQQGGSWADQTLQALGYDRDPSTLQLLVRTLFQAIESRGFDLPGVEAFPLFEVLDGKNTADYAHRVEPSMQGAQKMAVGLLRAALHER